MGASSTIYVSREAVLSKIMQELFQAKDEKLCDVLYDLWGYDHCYNFRIDPEGTEDSLLRT